MDAAPHEAVKGDYDNAAAVSAWYLAYQLQQLTFEANGKVGSVEEANKFALAGYKEGRSTVTQARKAPEAERGARVYRLFQGMVSLNSRIIGYD